MARSTVSRGHRHRVELHPGEQSLGCEGGRSFPVQGIGFLFIPVPQEELQVEEKRPVQNRNGGQNKAKACQAVFEMPILIAP